MARLPTAWPALALLPAAACSLLGLRHEVQQIEAHGVVSVQVEGAPQGVPLYAVAWSEEGGDKPAMTAVQPIGATGLASFLLRHDRRYGIGAFADVNGDKAYETGEPAASVRDVMPVPLDDLTRERKVLHLVLAADRLPGGKKFDVVDGDVEHGQPLSVHLGDLATLDDPRFSVEVGENGMWRPFEFLQEQGVGIFFLERYDPAKLPVLFVYGISGSPQDWRAIVGALDRSKYQPWIFQYPSGLRLQRSARGLATCILMLRKIHGFPRLAIVAHSMGGLVARGAIQAATLEAKESFVPRFVTIATPWGGHEAAAMGVDWLNYPVPAWRDMVPDSDYLKAVLAEPLPEGTRHDLIFTFQTKGGIGMPNDNDGVVGVKSQLVPAVQEAAHTVFGLPLSHTEVLGSPETFRRIALALQ